MSGFDVIIPARFGATRLPGKPLIDVFGKPLIVRVMESVARSQAERVVVATDDNRIAKTVLDHGGEVRLTAADHPSGTDRIAEVVDLLGLTDDRIVVNVQGDEPDMPGELIDQVAAMLMDAPELGMATAATPITTPDEWRDPSAVKVVTNVHGHALYFSRAPIPWRADEHPEPSELTMRHIGIYGYRAGFIRRFTKLAHSRIEQVERLEQLRVLYHGESIAVCRASKIPGPGVDTEEDLARARRKFANESSE